MGCTSIGADRRRGSINQAFIDVLSIGFVLGYLVVFLARPRGRSSERFHKAYYRYGFWLGIPVSLVFWVVFTQEYVTTASCYALIIIYIVFDVTVTYMAWQNNSGKGF